MSTTNEDINSMLNVFECNSGRANINLNMQTAKITLNIVLDQQKVNKKA
jgi:hypothetical protein